MKGGNEGWERRKCIEDGIKGARMRVVNSGEENGGDNGEKNRKKNGLEVQCKEYQERLGGMMVGMTGEGLGGQNIGEEMCVRKENIWERSRERRRKGEERDRSIGARIRGRMWWGNWRRRGRRQQQRQNKVRKAWGRGWIGNEDRREDRGQGHLQGVAKMEGVKAENERGQGEDGTEKTEVVGRLGILSLSSYSLLFCLQQVMLVAQ